MSEDSLTQIATLRTEVEKLTAKVQALELRLPAPSKPVESELQIIGIERPVDRPLQARQGFLMPTDSELRKLCSLVRKRWPELNTLQGLLVRTTRSTPSSSISKAISVSVSSYAKCD